jgi:hypothetical protein
MWDYFAAIAGDNAEYRELNVNIIAIAHTSVESLTSIVATTEQMSLPIRWVADSVGSAWESFTDHAPINLDTAAVFMLDMYGGVDSQRVVANFSALPDHQLLLDWARGAQFKCNI